MHQLSLECTLDDGLQQLEARRAIKGPCKWVVDSGRIIWGIGELLEASLPEEASGKPGWRGVEGVAGQVWSVKKNLIGQILVL